RRGGPARNRSPVPASCAPRPAAHRKDCPRPHRSQWESFDYAYGLVQQRVRNALDGKFNAIERLLAIVSVFQGIVEDPPVAGGCPILNTAIEADDANELLRDRARSAMNDWRTTIHRIVNKGIERQEIRPGVDADEVASILIVTLEGAIMLSNLFKDPVHMKRAADHMVRFIGTMRLL
ncbi:MAG TPA: TetR family transcriptional regulator C-terminal domain-containing protein, partial [Ktedonobacteraceae bacterium]